MDWLNSWMDYLNALRWSGLASKSGPEIAQIVEDEHASADDNGMAPAAAALPIAEPAPS